MAARGDGDEAGVSKTTPLLPLDMKQLAQYEPYSKTKSGVRKASDAKKLPVESVIVSIPPRLQLDTASRIVEPIQVVIYFCDKTCLMMQVIDGQNIEAGELFELVMEEMEYPAEAREVFSLWLVSDLLELQLKPNHVPFKLVCYWEELLDFYSSTKEDNKERDEPVIMFRRNVFYSKADEKKITDRELLKLLYSEAQKNILDAKYPISQQQCDELTGLQSLIVHSDDRTATHSPEYYKNHISKYYPPHFCTRKWLRYKSNPEYRLAESYKNAVARYGNNQPVETLYRTYLEFCWNLPYYGAAFFRGQAEHPGIRLLSSNVDDPVYVAINRDGVFVIDMDDVVLLVGVLFEELQWQYAESQKSSTNPNCLPCLFLQFPAKESGERVSKLLQIFSKEATLMDRMIEVCVSLRKMEKRTESMTGDDDHDGVIRGSGEIVNRFERLALLTFNCRGECIKNPMRRPRSIKQHNPQA